MNSKAYLAELLRLRACTEARLDTVPSVLPVPRAGRVRVLYYCILR